MGNSGSTSMRHPEDISKLDEPPLLVDSQGESRRHDYWQTKFSNRKRLSSSAIKKEKLSRIRDGSCSLNNVSSASSISGEHLLSVPTITVASVNETGKLQSTRSGGQQAGKTSLINRAQCQLGLTGVPRHKPIQCLTQMPSTKPATADSQRSASTSRLGLQSSSKIQTSSKNQNLSTSRMANTHPTRLANFKFNQQRAPTKEYLSLAKPAIRKRAGSAGNLLQQTSSVSNLRKTASRRVSRRPSKPPQSRLEYTFYIRDTAEHRRPFIENTADTIARGCQCTIELIQPGKGFPPVFYKGVRVCPVTITTTNMGNLRRCLARLDARYPGFNAKAFMPC
ncbi:hypothetical protein Aperf_G00000091517 [Anoplocephala perfoliata]